MWLIFLFSLYLQRIDLDAVLVSMSCFNLLCKEADIRCGNDDVNVTYISVAQLSRLQELPFPLSSQVNLSLVS